MIKNYKNELCLTNGYLHNGNEGNKMGLLKVPLQKHVYSWKVLRTEKYDFGNHVCRGYTSFMN